MISLGQQLKRLRQEKSLSQADVANRTGLLRCYISRIENGYTIPGIETLEKFSHALEAPLYRLFYDGEAPPPPPPPVRRRRSAKARGATRKEEREFRRFQRELAAMDDAKRKLLLLMAQKMVRGKAAKRRHSSPERSA